VGKPGDHSSQDDEAAWKHLAGIDKRLDGWPARAATCLEFESGELIEGKTEGRKTKLVASLAPRGGTVVGFLLKSYGNTG
jgi:hypothetical protein